MQSFSKMIEDKLDKFIDQISEFKNVILDTLSTKFQYHGLTKFEKQILVKVQTGIVDEISGSTIWNAIVKTKTVSTTPHLTTSLH